MSRNIVYFSRPHHCGRVFLFTTAQLFVLAFGGVTLKATLRLVGLFNICFLHHVSPFLSLLLLPFHKLIVLTSIAVHGVNEELGHLVHLGRKQDWDSVAVFCIMTDAMVNSFLHVFKSLDRVQPSSNHRMPQLLQLFAALVLGKRLNARKVFIRFVAEAVV